MLSQILEEKDFDPTIMIGGESGLLGKKGGKVGKGIVSVYESDESDGTFLKHKANIRILTNIDNDHLDYYKNLEALQSSFFEYLNVEGPGHAVVCGEDPGVQGILNGTLKSSTFHPDFELWISIDSKHKEKYEWISKLRILLQDKLHIVSYKVSDDIFSIEDSNSNPYIVQVPFPGWHYKSNALLAILAAKILGVSELDSANILSRYVGVKRRQEILGDKKGIQVIDDYGHHPTEIGMVIQSLTQSIKNEGRLVVLFQPHRFTRTQLLLKELADSLTRAKYLFLLPIYSAGENPIPNVTTESFLEFLSPTSTKLLSGRIEEDIPILETFLHPNDRLLCLGAGNVRDWGLAFLNR
jgi:UDP-N-acetylmuramate--alanine ligase